MYRKFGKRMFDITASLIGIVILSPLLLVLAVLIKIKLGSPVIFMQERPGLNGKIFKLYKFRSMTDERDVNGDLLPDAARLTPFGKTLRSSSLDELPELWNILTADMSIVGPRPLLVRYLPLYNDEQRRRHEVKPGLTGLAQVNGRNAISWEDKFRFDCRYVDNISFIVDVKIIIATVSKVLKREDIADTEGFTGNK